MVLRKWSELQTLASSRQALELFEASQSQKQTSKRPPKSDEIILKLMARTKKKKSTYEVDNSQKAEGLEGREQKRIQNEACNRGHVNESWVTQLIQHINTEHPFYVRHPISFYFLRVSLYSTGWL